MCYIKQINLCGKIYENAEIDYLFWTKIETTISICQLFQFFSANLPPLFTIIPLINNTFYSKNKNVIHKSIQFIYFLFFCSIHSLQSAQSRLLSAPSHRDSLFCRISRNFLIFIYFLFLINFIYFNKNNNFKK